MATVIERVDRLEEVLRQFITSVGIEFNKLYNSQLRTEAELREFKDEMRAFKDEMHVFKDEMRAFKDEMLEFKEENRRQTRQMNRQWGELANRLGTLWWRTWSTPVCRVSYRKPWVEKSSGSGYVSNRGCQTAG